MSQDFGIQMPVAHTPSAHGSPVRYLVLADAGGTRVARLFRENHDLVNEFDAAVTEVVMMTVGLTPGGDAMLARWDWATCGLNDEERAAAQIYILPSGLVEPAWQAQPPGSVLAAIHVSV